MLEHPGCSIIERPWCSTAALQVQTCGGQTTPRTLTNAPSPMTAPDRRQRLSTVPTSRGSPASAPNDPERPERQTLNDRHPHGAFRPASSANGCRGLALVAELLGPVEHFVTCWGRYLASPSHCHGFLAATRGPASSRHLAATGQFCWPLPGRSHWPLTGLWFASISCVLGIRSLKVRDCQIEPPVPTVGVGASPAWVTAVCRVGDGVVHPEPKSALSLSPTADGSRWR